MKKTGIGIGLLMLAVSVWFWLRIDQSMNDRNKSGETVITPSITPPAAELKFKTVSLNEKNYGYVLFKGESNVKLVSNYSQKETAKTISENLNCSFGINGGFYDENGKALGWVAIDGVTVSNYRNSTLLNGYLSVDGERWKAETAIPMKADFGVQSGPVLMENSQPVTLNMARDKMARRMFSAVTADGNGYFGSVFAVETPLLGPNLADLPDLVFKIGKAEGLNWKNALNLDGGSASAFKNNDFWLEEVSSIGSWWCFSE